MSFEPACKAYVRLIKAKVKALSSPGRASDALIFVSADQMSLFFKIPFQLIPFNVQSRFFRNLYIRVRLIRANYITL